jgi:hypothetical protein
MKYMESNNFVHRDLAARNVLVASPTICKIGWVERLPGNGAHLAVRVDGEGALMCVMGGVGCVAILG